MRIPRKSMIKQVEVWEYEGGKLFRVAVMTGRAVRLKAESYPSLSDYWTTRLQVKK